MPQFLYSWGNNSGTHGIEGLIDPREDVKVLEK
jgi:hypothetical protein